MIPKNIDGVIVLHGTDTLAYTSSLAAMVCRSLPIPVGFVGANYPLKHPKSNAFVNFRAAVEYLKAGGRGFFVPDENSDGKTRIHLATRLTEADSLTTISIRSAMPFWQNSRTVKLYSQMIRVCRLRRSFQSLFPV